VQQKVEYVQGIKLSVLFEEYEEYTKRREEFEECKNKKI
jgi:hypothetical protein